MIGRILVEIDERVDTVMGEITEHSERVGAAEMAGNASAAHGHKRLMRVCELELSDLCAARVRLREHA